MYGAESIPKHGKDLLGRKELDSREKHQPNNTWKEGKCHKKGSPAKWSVNSSIGLSIRILNTSRTRKQEQNLSGEIKRSWITYRGTDSCKRRWSLVDRK